MNKEPDSMLAHMFKDKGECNTSFAHLRDLFVTVLTLQLLSFCTFNDINNFYKSKNLLVCYTVFLL